MMVSSQALILTRECHSLKRNAKRLPAAHVDERMVELLQAALPPA